MKINCLQNLSMKEIINTLYPIGSYYETSNTIFDPNLSWVGEWIQDSQGYVTVGANTNEDMLTKYNLVDLQVNDKIGEAKHTLTINELAKHYHLFRVVQDNVTDSGSGLPKGASDSGNNKGYGHFVDDAGNRAVDYTGGDQPHNNTQPSIGVIRWHRIG